MQWTRTRTAQAPNRKGTNAWVKSCRVVEREKPKSLKVRKTALYHPWNHTTPCTPENNHGV